MAESKFYQAKWFKIGAGAFGGLILLLLLVPFLVSIDYFIPQITGLIEEQTGRKAEIETIRLHIIPSIRVQVVNFRIKNPDGFPEGDTILVKSINIGAELMPLLDKQLKVTYINIHGVEVNLLENSRGRTNYDFTPARKPKKKKAEPAEGESSFSLGPIDSIAISNVTLSSGTYNTRRKEVTPAFTMTGLDTELRDVAIEDPKFLKRLTVNVDLSKVEITTPALTKPVQFSEGAFTVKDGAGEGAFKASLGAIQVAGGIKIKDLNKPRADFNVTIPELNLLKLAALSSGGSGGSSGGSKRSAPVPRKLLARGNVKIGRLVYPPFTASNFKSKIRLYTHKIDVNSFSLAFYDGTVSGSANLNTVAASKPLSLKSKIQKVNVEKLVKAAAPGSTRKITGTFGANANLTTALAGDPAATLRGNGNFAVRNGTLPGLDLQGKLIKTAKILQMGVPKGDTKFKFLGGDFRVQNERVHSRQIKLDSDTLQATVKGSFGLDGTLDYKGSGMLTGKGNDTAATETEEKKSSNPFAAIGRAIGGTVAKTIGVMRVFKVPVAIKGTFEDPQILLAGKPQPIRDSNTAQTGTQEPPKEERKGLFGLFRKKKN